MWALTGAPVPGQRTTAASPPVALEEERAPGAGQRQTLEGGAVALNSNETILNYARTTKTETGLKVTASLSRRRYQLGEKVTQQEIAALNIHVPRVLPQWNDSIPAQAANRVKLFPVRP